MVKYSMLITFLKNWNFFNLKHLKKKEEEEEVETLNFRQYSGENGSICFLIFDFLLSCLSDCLSASIQFHFE